MTDVWSCYCRCGVSTYYLLVLAGRGFTPWEAGNNNGSNTSTFAFLSL